MKERVCRSETHNSLTHSSTLTYKGRVFLIHPHSHTRYGKGTTHSSKLAYKIRVLLIHPNSHTREEYYSSKLTRKGKSIAHPHSRTREQHYAFTQTHTG